MNTRKKVKKVLVLTVQPLGLNYGGTVQAYALQKTLKRLGFETVTYNENLLNLRFKEIKNTLKFFISNNTIKRGSGIKRYHIPESILTRFTKSFVKENIKVQTSLTSIKGSASSVYDAVVVGSDQVWRKDYVDISRYLLDFTNSMEVVRISYAASFGKDDIADYGEELLQTSKYLAGRFDAISVRENSAIEVCKKYWGVNAVQVLDPTMLLSKEDYKKLIDQELSASDSVGGIFSYILDETELTSSISKAAEKQLLLDTYKITPPLPKNYRDLFKNSNSYAWPSVAKWLKGFYDADYVITDSFHGTVFSIIFNKPFIAIGNKERGMARFSSLLKTFGLENRLVSEVSDITPGLLMDQINWLEVNEKLNLEQNISLEFLSKYLGATSE